MRRSKVKQAPPEIRAELERMWREGAPTLDAMMAFLHEKGIDFESDPEKGISRSGLHRYLKNFGEVAERMHEAERVAGSVIGSLSESTGGNTRRMLTQLLSMIALYQVRAAESGDLKVGPRDLMFLAKAIRDIEGAFKTGAETEFEIRKRLAEELTEKVSKKVEEARAGGIDPIILERAKELVRGAIDG